MLQHIPICSLAGSQHGSLLGDLGYVSGVHAVLCSDKNLMADFAATMRSKTGMKTLFGKKNIKKDNTEGKVSEACKSRRAYHRTAAGHTCL